MKVHNRVREIRESRGKSIREMAADLGMSRQTIYDIEGQDYNPTVKLMARIAEYLGVSISELFDGERVA